MRPGILAAILLVIATYSASAATIVIINKDGAGVGFNDPTPAAAVGGNVGTTLGQQRLNAFQYAASIWGAKLSSPITIKIAAKFSPLTPCSPTSGVIGSAGATNYLRDFPNAPRAGTWYPIALASALAGEDFADAAPGHSNLPDGASISASFNSSVGSPTCLTGTFFYLGLDANEGSGIDLVATLLHEFGHGLGFAGIANLTTGALANGFPDDFSVFTRDNSLLMNWPAMSNAQRAASVINTGNVVFDGPNATGAAMTILTTGRDAMQHPKLYTPNPQEPGSSVYHFDTSASPNQLMEPVINDDLTHNVDIPNDLTTKSFADMGWPMPAGAVVPPSFVTAVAASPTSVNVTWVASPGAASYRVFRTAHNSTVFTQIASGIAGTAFNDTTVLGDRAYLYKVRAFDGATESGDSNTDLATTVIFTDPTLTSGVTPVKAAHFTQLRTAANAVRALGGLGGGTYTDATLDSTVFVKGVHVTDIYTALNAARTSLSLTTLSAPPIIAGTTTVQAVHLTTLRTGVQ